MTPQTMEDIKLLLTNAGYEKELNDILFHVLYPLMISSSSRIVVYPLLLQLDTSCLY